MGGGRGLCLDLVVDLGLPGVLPLLVDSEEQQNVGTTDQDDDTFELKPGYNGR